MSKDESPWCTCKVPLLDDEAGAGTDSDEDDMCWRCQKPVREADDE